MHGFARRGTGLLLLPFWLSACVSWTPQPVEPQRFITESQPSKVQLIMADSTVMRMRDPRILRDSVIGDQDVGNTNRRVAVPLGDVTQVQTSRFSIGKTTLAGLGIVAGLVALIVLADANQSVY